MKITIPSRKHWAGIVILGSILWFMGPLTIWPLLAPMFNASARPSDEDLLSLLLVLPLFGLMVAYVFYLAYVFVWNLIGKEEIIVSQQAIVVRRKLLGIGRSHQYLADHVKDIRLSSGWLDNRVAEWITYSFGMPTKGPLAFDYGVRTFHLASGADEAEAKQILSLIWERFPQYRNTPHAPRTTENPS